MVSFASRSVNIVSTKRNHIAVKTSSFIQMYKLQYDLYVYIYIYTSTFKGVPYMVPYNGCLASPFLRVFLDGTPLKVHRKFRTIDPGIPTTIKTAGWKNITTIVEP